LFSAPLNKEPRGIVRILLLLWHKLFLSLICPVAVLTSLTRLLSFFFFSVLGFELRAYNLSHSKPFFCDGFLKIGSQKLFAQAGFKSTLLLISVFLVARITEVSHWCPTSFCLNLTGYSDLKSELFPSLIDWAVLDECPLCFHGLVSLQ
jgi:hypothetical protein